MQATIHNEFLTPDRGYPWCRSSQPEKCRRAKMLWQADPAVWKRHAPILFPWTGKLTGGTFTHGGKTYQAASTALPGMWGTPCSAPRATPSGWSCARMKSKAERFPFDFVLTSTFRLEGKTVHHTLTVTNPADAAELQFGIGSHPAFRIPFDDKHTTTDYEFRFDQPESPMILDAYPTVCSPASAVTGGRTQYPHPASRTIC